MTILNHEISSGIKISREQSGLNEFELANMLKIDISTLRGWESGAGSIPIATIKKLAAILNTSSELILFAENREPLVIESLADDQRAIIWEMYRLIKSYK